jgi:TRAP-type uncharacterized transport system fused permease subunit
VIFGAVLNAGEAGQGFMNVADGRGRTTSPGGAAKVSVMSLGALRVDLGFGLGQRRLDRAITLPAMTKLGYPKRLAARRRRWRPPAGRSCRR